MRINQYKIRYALIDEKTLKNLCNISKYDIICPILIQHYIELIKINK